VWCHDALDIEAAVDRTEGRIPAGSGWSQQTESGPPRDSRRRPGARSQQRFGPTRSNGPTRPAGRYRPRTGCVESNGTAQPNSAPGANGNIRRHGWTLLPNGRSRASACSEGLRQVGHFRSTC
jgi:hypothetical protein